MGKTGLEIGVGVRRNATIFRLPSLIAKLIDNFPLTNIQKISTISRYDSQILISQTDLIITMRFKPRFGLVLNRIDHHWEWR
jgi:hypothetical protein